MNSNNLSILFIINKSKTNSKNLSPLRCRLTYQGKRKLFSVGLFVDSKNWSSKKQKVLSQDPENSYLNKHISLINQKLKEAYLFLQVNEHAFDVQDILLKYKGENTKSYKSILDVFELHNKRMESLIGKEYAKSTFSKFLEARKHVKNFILFKYKKNDLLLDSIKSNFIDDLDFYLKTELNQKQITINKTIQRLRKIIKLAIGEGFLDKDPFILYTPKRYENKLVYLTQEELILIQDKTFAQERLNKVKDMFIFCCYTGLAFAEMTSLETKHLISKFDGNLWIDMYRQKTKSKVTVPLLPKALEIIEKYKTENNDKVLPKLSNQKFNSYIKEIAEILGIDKKLTHHIARKTFATTVLLYNDVPMEVVSELLGHSKITITQKHYAKVVQKKLSEEVTKLKFKIN
jgi:site-specific recombinase XerD